MAIDLTNYIISLESMGFFDVALPFLLVFVLIFGILEKIQLFGTRSGQINIVIGIIIAFFVIKTGEVVEIMNMFLPKVSLAVLVLVMGLMIIGIFGLRAEGFKGYPLFIGVLASVGAIIWALSSGVVAMPSWLQMTGEQKAFVIGFGALILIMYFVVRQPGQGDTRVGGRVRRGLADLAEELGRGGQP
ncbi:MAG: hypothetical protein ABIF40_02950 [archaeon]